MADCVILFSIDSIAFRTPLTRLGELIPLCGVPATVEKSFFFSTKPAFSHCASILRPRIRYLNIRSWLMLSMQPLIFPSRTHCADDLCASTTTHRSIASAAECFGRKSYECNWLSFQPQVLSLTERGAIVHSGDPQRLCSAVLFGNIYTS